MRMSVSSLLHFRIFSEQPARGESRLSLFSPDAPATGEQGEIAVTSFFGAMSHRLLFVGVTLSLMVGGLVALSSPGASADTAPAPGTPATVSADGLPTWQVNGVVWDSVVVGNTAYVTGEFTRARPPGVPVGGA